MRSFAIVCGVLGMVGNGVARTNERQCCCYEQTLQVRFHSKVIRSHMYQSAIRTSAICVATFCTFSAFGQELIQPPKDSVHYQLSNLRVEKGIIGDLIVFDYKRTKAGSGKAKLAARTDQGPISITGFGLRIEDSGTIRLEDRFARTREILNRGGNQTGIEFYFVSGNDYDFQKQFLISNSIRHGSMNTKVSARPLNAEELMLAEIERKAKIPPETEPPGHTRTNESTKLVVGAPVLFGQVGEWKEGTIADLSNRTFAKVYVEGHPSLISVRRDKWLAISPETAEKIRTDPSQFSINVRTLPNGNLILGDDLEPLSNAMNLLKGTPLLMEKYSKWEDVHFLSSDNVNVRILTNKSRKLAVETIPIAKFAIRKQTLADQESETAKEAFAANVADYESGAANFPVSGTMESATGLNRGGQSPTPPKSEEVAAEVAKARTWSDTTGKFKIEARYINHDSTNVMLQRTDGKKVQVPLARLSAPDQAFLKNLDGNPFATSQQSSGSSADYSLPLTTMTTIGDLRWGAKSVAISPNNQFLMIGRKAASASLCDLKTGRILIDSGRMNHMGDIGACGFTPNGKYALIAGSKGVVEVYELNEKGQMKLARQVAAHTKEVTSLAFSADSKFVMTGSADKEARYWELETGRQITTLSGFKGKVKACRISPAGNTLLATDGGELQVYDVDQGKVTQTVTVSRSHATGQDAAFSPNGLLLVVGDSYDFHVWNLETYSELPLIKGTEIAWSIVFAPDNQHFFSGGNGVINVWDAKRQTRVLSHPVGSSFYVQALATNGDGTLLSSPSDHSSVVVVKAAAK